ncbi:MAG: hypothetical protein JM58_07140 [Peptococcaceae bacterium BICA1-8]|nr:MAG: hypothetical protein JM58_07140 [Peptococcaceae bacterium BICA1-8]
MELEERARLISYHVQEWLVQNNKSVVKPKDVIPYLIEKGLYENDNRKGNPLRKDLRKLDDMNRLDLIEGLQVDRKETKRYWYFYKV